ncbi:hypothetical protein MKO06_04520 [Gramella sp. GC03-9]|uniref:Uncharacterized protein n=1 Tax=Christiangramia oceanisediminis TaxID=2920386 RepID=A0A9X2I1X6_9FLAO|nr:hypothetical protein [Gramella oceanisediminis]MCP9199160.1 hypothetical protein [Gramella oceanisediminis]
MKKYGFGILVLIVLLLIIYVTFIKALIELSMGIGLVVLAAVILWFIWKKLKSKTQD